MADINSPKRPYRRKAGGRGELEQGFYSTTFNRREMADLNGTNQVSLTDEIAMLRVYTRRLLEYSNTLEPSLDTFVTLTRTIGASASRLAKMLETHSKLKEKEKDRIAAEVSRALNDFVEEFKI